MANNIQNVSFTNPSYGYGAELSEIERRKLLAKALQDQALSPIDLPQTPAGGFTPKLSPWQGVNKLAQGLVSGYAGNKAQEAQKALSEKSQADYQTMIAKGLRELQGTPARAEEVMPADVAGPPNPAREAVAPNPAAALGTFASHPMGQQLAPLALKEIDNQKRQQLLAQVLRGGQAGGGGIADITPDQAMTLIASGDPTAKVLGEAALKRIESATLEAGRNQRFSGVSGNTAATQAGQDRRFGSVSGNTQATIAANAPLNQARVGHLNALTVLDSLSPGGTIPTPAPQGGNQRSILEGELAKERALLAQATDPQRQRLHTNNIEMLTKEIAGMPGIVGTPMPGGGAPMQTAPIDREINRLPQSVNPPIPVPQPSAQGAPVPVPAQPPTPVMPQFAGTLRQRMAAENQWRLQQAKPSIAGAAQFTPEALAFTARQYLAGDRQATQGFARNATARIALQNAIVDEAARQGLSPSQTAAKIAEFAGTVAGSRTVGQRAANISLAATEAQEMIPIVKEQSDKFARSDFVPWNQALRAYESNTGSPEIAAFGASINALVNVYARAINPTGVPTVSDKEHARAVLNTVQSPAQVDAVLGIIRRELDIAKKAPQTVRESITGSVSGTQPQRRSSDANNDRSLIDKYLK